MRKFFSVFVLLLLSVVVLSGCGAQQQARLAGSSGELDFTPDKTIRMSDFKFEPSTIKAKAGEKLMLKVESKEGSHNFVLEELGINGAMLSKGDSETVTIIIPEDAKGKEYEFHCGVSGHKEQGMVGKLIVK